MIAPMIRLIGLIVLIITSWAYAASEQQVYQVEVILFKQLPVTTPLLERWPAHPAMPDLTSGFPLVAEPELGLDTLDARTFRLKHEAKRLSSTGYEILWHGAWQQPYQWQVPLILKRTKPCLIHGTLLLNTGQRTNPEFKLHLLINGNVWSAKRRIKLGELTYIDHPNYGLLIRAWLVDAVVAIDPIELWADEPL